MPGGTAFCSILAQHMPDLETIDPISVILLAIEVVMMVMGAHAQGLRFGVCLVALE